MPYTTWGSVRGCCGHAHRTYEEAERCLHNDQIGCRRQPTNGYSDREIREIESLEELRGFDVTRGPGRRA